MSGIAAVLRFRPPFGRCDRTRAMLARVGHRALDGAVVMERGPLAVAYGPTTVKGAREAPRVDGQGRVAVLDGWLADRRRTARAVDLDPESSDTAIALAAFARGGVSAIGALRGEFSLLLWDPDRGDLLLARDTMGVRPLFYSDRGQELRVASEPAGLLLESDPRPTVNRRDLALALVEEVGPLGSTLLEGISAVVPGTILVVTAAGHRTLHMARPLTELGGTLRSCSRADAIEMLEATLRDAVRDSLDADGPASVMVSGGVDSTVVAALALQTAREAGLPAPRLYTWRYPGMSCDESTYTALLARHLDVEITGLDVPLDADAYRARGPIDLIHEASFAPLIATRPLLEQAGSRVLLGGIGADELMITQGFEVEDALASGEIGRAAAFARLRGPTDVMGLRRLATGLVRTVWPARLRGFLGAARWGEPTHAPVWVTDGARVLIRAGRVERRRSLRRAHSSRLTDEFLFRELMAGWQGPRMLEQCDYSAAAIGVQARYPYLDTRVIDLFLSLPSRVRYDPAWQKVLLRGVAEKHLPRAIAWRQTKTEFSDFYRHAAYIREAEIRALFESSRLEALGLARRDGLLDLLERARGPGFLTFGRELGSAIGAEIWLRRYGLP